MFYSDRRYFMQITVTDVQKNELTKARKILGTLGYKIYTTRRWYNRSGHSFIAINRNSICLLCPRGDRLEIRLRTFAVTDYPIIRHLRERLSLPLRVGKKLPFKPQEDGKRFILKDEHVEFKMFLPLTRLS